MVAVGLQFLAVNGWQAGKTVAVDEASGASATKLLPLSRCSPACL